MEIDQSINDEPNTLDIEPEKEKTPVTNHGDIPPMSIGKLFILLFLSINSLILLNYHFICFLITVKSSCKLYKILTLKKSKSKHFKIRYLIQSSLISCKSGETTSYFIIFT